SKTILIPKCTFTKSQEKLIRKLETLDINREVAEELVRASHPKAIKNWIALMEYKQSSEVNNNQVLGI
ncbi:hypothetical protein LR013_03740, partial [candidate division NPL-UPA2 bacterium]|nr:hypothetical protein [candidate division NPL-UPA2 bacterium]